MVFALPRHIGAVDLPRERDLLLRGESEEVLMDLYIPRKGYAKRPNMPRHQIVSIDCVKQVMLVHSSAVGQGP